MITALWARARELRLPPPGPLAPIVGGLLILIGTRQIARFIDHQRAQLVEACDELYRLDQHARQMQLRAADRAAEYPAQQDLNPLRVGAGDEDPDDERAVSGP
jgi:hypothetical protein